MHRLLTLKRLLGALLLGLLLLLAAVAQEFRLFERAWLPVQEWRHRSEWRAVSIGLPDYRVALLRGRHGPKKSVPRAAGIASDAAGNT